MIGQSINHYKITAKLGEGGMGAVYRATDTRLGREVALKIVPEKFARDPQRMGRFQREAEVLASLDHPHISTIHGLEVDGDVQALVLELVEGPTLAERIAKGPIPTEEALGMALQIAEALEAAHEKGIIHRDLKPANVKITPEGKVKVLDFGLAKALEDEIPAADLTHSPTRTDQMTNVGVIMGTAGYMSPEQARGQPLDKRTDIWAFGCVLYEMLTGKQVFGGETATDILGAIVHKDPNWEALPEGTPRAIHRLLRRCLEKDTHERLRDIGDARIVIKYVAGEPVDDFRVGAPTATPVWWRPTIPSAALGLVVLLMGVLLGFVLWSPENASQPGPRTVTRFPIILPRGETIPPQPSLALSPDGTQLVYVAVRDNTRRLHLRATDQLEAKTIPGTEGGWAPFFSPDGKSGGFFTGQPGEGDLKKWSLLGGGEPATICEVGVGRGGSWGEDGRIVFGRRPGGLWRVSDAGGSLEKLTGVGFDFLPQILPGGKSVVFHRFEEETSSIIVLSLETGEEKILIQSGTFPRYAPTGHLIYALDERLLAVPFNLETLKVMGEPTPVLEELWRRVGGVRYSISENGTLAYIPKSDPASRGNRLVWVDRRGEQEAVTETRRDFSSVRFSPDGKRLGVAVGSRLDAEVWIYGIARGILSPLTTGGGWGPIWTRDGTRLAFTRMVSQPGLFWMAADGGGKVEQLTTGMPLVPFSWSPDSNVLAFTAYVPSRNFDISLLSPGGEPQPFLATEFQESQPMFSPNGRWITFTSDHSGREEVYVKAYPEGGGIEPISTDGGTQPLWAHSGRELFYRNGEKVMVVSIQTEPTLKAEAPRQLFTYPEGPAEFFGGPLTYDIAPDDQRFVFIEQEWATQINVVLNWFEELKQKVPTDN